MDGKMEGMMSMPKQATGVIVVIVVAVLVGAWLYADSVRADLQGQIDELRAERAMLK